MSALPLPLVLVLPLLPVPALPGGRDEPVGTGRAGREAG